MDRFNPVIERYRRFKNMDILNIVNLACFVGPTLLAKHLPVMSILKSDHQYALCVRDHDMF